MERCQRSIHQNRHRIESLLSHLEIEQADILSKGLLNCDHQLLLEFLEHLDQESVCFGKPAKYTLTFSGWNNKDFEQRQLFTGGKGPSFGSSEPFPPIPPDVQKVLRIYGIQWQVVQVVVQVVLQVVETEAPSVCKICRDAQVDRLLPCHHALCAKCATAIRRCPFCHRGINPRAITSLYLC